MHHQQEYHLPWHKGAPGAEKIAWYQRCSKLSKPFSLLNDFFVFVSHTPPPHLPYSGTYVLVHKYRSSPAGGYSVSLPLTLQLIPENFLASPGRKAKGVWKVLSKAIPSRNTKPVLLLLVLICIHLNKRCLVSNFSTHLFKHKSKMLANLG